MTDKTPQDEMSERLSKLARERAGRLVNPTMSEMIQARRKRYEEGIHRTKDISRGGSRREKTAAVRSVVAGGKGDRVNRTLRGKRKEQLGKLKPGKPKIIRRE